MNTIPNDFDLNDLRLQPDAIGRIGRAKAKKYKPKHGEKFIKGPIPWEWVQRAALQPGKSLHVSVAIWFLAGLKKSHEFSLSQSVMRDMGVKRHAAYRALEQLERAKLIEVKRKRGANPMIRILATDTSA